MNGRYRIKTPWRIFLILGCTPLAGLFIYLLIELLRNSTINVILLVFLVAVFLAMIGLMLYGIADAIVGYYEINDDVITHRTVFGKKIIQLSDIKGVSVNDKYIRFVPKPGKKSLNISFYVRESDNIAAWAYGRFGDVDQQEAEEEDIEVLREVTQHIPAAEHDERLRKARSLAKYVSWTAYGTGLWAFFYPHPSYDVAVVAAMLVPIVIIVAIWWSKGFIRFNGSDKSRYPVMAFPLLVPIGALGIRTLFDFEVLDYGNLWAEAGAITVTLVLAAMWASKEFSFRDWTSGFTILFFAVLFYAYSICSLVIINCRFDSTGYETFTAGVLGKEISSGKTTTYYLDLAPWGPRTEHEKVPVGRNAYQWVNVGDTVEIYLYEGRLKAKWFEVRI